MSAFFSTIIAIFMSILSVILPAKRRSSFLGDQSPNFTGASFIIVDGVTSPYTKNHPVYTNIEGNKGGNHLGSRLAADRPPNSGNHTEYNNPNKAYEGYDHIVLNNVDYFTLSGEKVKGGAFNTYKEYSGLAIQYMFNYKRNKK